MKELGINTVFSEANKSLSPFSGIKLKLLGARNACLFYDRLIKEEKDVAYYGDTVTAEDVDEVLMRWKVSDGEYKVIYGNLSTGTVGE